MESAKKIIEELKKLGFSKYKISKKSGLSNPTLARWENELNKPDPDKFAKLERFYKKVTEEKLKKGLENGK